MSKPEQTVAVGFCQITPRSTVKDVTLGLVQRTVRDLQESRELGRPESTETFRDVPRCRGARIANLIPISDIPPG